MTRIWGFDGSGTWRVLSLEHLAFVLQDTMPEYLEKCKIIPSGILTGPSALDAFVGFCWRPGRNCHMLRLWLNYRMREA